jgi:hypothetical protein
VKKLLVFVLLFTAMLLLQRELDARRVEHGSAMTTGALPKPGHLRALSLGHEEVLSDFYWVKAVLYEGTERTEKDYRYFSSLIDLVTTLDPYFQYPYIFGSVILSVMANDPAASDKLLLQGFTYHRDTWRFPFGLGYNAYFHYGDPRGAARYLGIAATLDGCPAYVPRLASRLYHESGSIDVAIRFLTTIAREMEDGEERRILETRIEALRMIQFLEGIVSQYRKDLERNPLVLDDLVRAGYLHKVPSDPYGGRFYLDEECNVYSTSRLRPVVPYETKGGDTQ